VGFARCGVLLEQKPDRYLRSPRFARLEGELFLGAIAWDGAHWPGAEWVLRWRVRDLRESEISRAERSSGDVARGIVALDATLAPLDAEESPVTILHEDGVASVSLGETLVWRARGSASAGCAAVAEGGTWVAWHTDVREETHRADVAKWIVVRFVTDDQRVLAPPDLPDRDRDLDGEEQSFEFPQLVAGEDGALTLLGRGSHNFYRQDLSAEGWTPRQPLSDGAWGSRGRRCVGALHEGELVIARRERRGIAVDWLPAPTGGRPPLVAAVVDLAEPRIRLVRPPDPAPEGLHTYFGDIQQHTAHSDGCGSAEEVYERARWRYGDDFVALTDHESFLGKRTGPGEWRYLQDVADRFDEPGAFATLLAYEWTGKMYPGPGHKCVYLPRRDMPLVSRDELPEGKDLVQRIKSLGGIASPHHIGWTGCDEDGHDDLGQPVWEICSCHGIYEREGHPLGMRGEHTHQLADVMLRKGHRFGFTASSDSHGLLWHHGESRKRDPYRTGLTAVQAPALTRDAVFEALRARRTYATTGAKIMLDFTVDEAPMGSALAAGGGRARVVAYGTDDLVSLELVTEEGVAHAATPDGPHGALEGDVAGRFVYARVVQRDGEHAWASPVFFG